MADLKNVKTIQIFFKAKTCIHSNIGAKTVRNIIQDEN